eukprot:755055-Hanusia_phi.AAC.2
MVLSLYQVLRSCVAVYEQWISKKELASEKGGETRRYVQKKFSAEDTICPNIRNVSANIGGGAGAGGAGAGGGDGGLEV